MVDNRTHKTVDQPSYPIKPEDEVVVVDTDVISASAASVASLASLASTASFGTAASIASAPSRASIASYASAGTLSSAASYGTTTSAASVAFRYSIASVASQGTVGGFSRAARASQGSIPAMSSPIKLTLPVMTSAETLNIVRKGSASNVVEYVGESAETISGLARITIDGEHDVDFVIPTDPDAGSDWTLHR